METRPRGRLFSLLASEISFAWAFSGQFCSWWIQSFQKIGPFVNESSQDNKPLGWTNFTRHQNNKTCEAGVSMCDWYNKSTHKYPSFIIWLTGFGNDSQDLVGVCCTLNGIATAILCKHHMCIGLGVYACVSGGSSTCPSKGRWTFAIRRTDVCKYGKSLY